MSKAKPKFARVAQLKTPEIFRNHIATLNTDLPFKDEMSAKGESKLATSYALHSGREIGNRFCILPMEGWDGTLDGLPTEHTKRRWHHFATSGAKLIWGCEAVAVSHDGRANPNQLLMSEAHLPAFKELYTNLISDHESEFGTSADLLVGLQLTHSGRFAVPDPDRIKQPKTLYKHSILDKKFKLSENHEVLTDEEIDEIVSNFITAAALAKEAGFDFVDIKHCHGYLGHEFLSAKNRKGNYGGSLENRMCFLRSIVEGIRRTSDIKIGVRLSAFDCIPFKKGEDATGIPTTNSQPYDEAFGATKDGLGINLDEIFELIQYISDLDIELLCVTAGSPYYVPHITRPALFPPSDGYLPPEDPLVGVARQIRVTDEIKKKFPELAIIGSGYSYLQEWLPHVAEAVIDEDKADFVGLGRMVLSYPQLAKDILEGTPLTRGRICRTFSDCTTGPRIGILSGCFPLDPYYKAMQEATTVKEYKKTAGL